MQLKQSDWNPWHELNRLRHEFGRPTSHQPTRFSLQHGSFPLINAWKNKEGLVLTMEIPGIDPDALDLTVKPETLRISGMKAELEPESQESCLRQERPTGPFERQIELPFEVDPNQTEATYERGILTITLHRPAEHKPKKVTIQTG